jgi:hypothetical protein
MAKNENELSHIDVHALVQELADRMELNEEEQDKFTDRCMTRAGYKPTKTYAPPEGKDNERSESERRSKGWF